MASDPTRTAELGPAPSVYTDLESIDPRGMAEIWTTDHGAGAKGMLGLAQDYFGVVFDDKSEIDIYKVYIGPPSETTMGFFNPNQEWAYALRAEQTSWADVLSEEEDAIAEVHSSGARAKTSAAGAVLPNYTGTPYGDSPHMTDTYEDYLGYIEDPDGYNVAQFAGIMQYASLYNWQDIILGDMRDGDEGDAYEIDPNVAMANNTVNLIQPFSTDDSSSLTNGASTLPQAGDNPGIDADIGLDDSGYGSGNKYTGEFMALSETSAQGVGFREALRQTWKSRDLVTAEHEAFLSEQTILVANTAVHTIDTKFMAKRQRSPPLPSSALTALHPGTKTRPTSTYTEKGYDWLGLE